MDLWIGVENGDGRRTLRVMGRLDGEGVAELERVARSPGLPVRVDLSRLYSAAEVGVEALRRLAREGVELVGARPLIAYRLQDNGQEPPDRDGGPGDAGERPNGHGIDDGKHGSGS